MGEEKEKEREGERAEKISTIRAERKHGLEFFFRKKLNISLMFET
jgi:hypothetical protein